MILMWGEKLQQKGIQSQNVNVEAGINDASDLEGNEIDWESSDGSQEFVIPRTR